MLILFLNRERDGGMERARERERERERERARAHARKKEREREKRSDYAFSITDWCMGWLRLLGSLKLHVSFAEYSLFHRALL